MSQNNNKISFVLKGDIIHLDLSSGPNTPTTTVLNYLRSLSGFKGVKEGCAEGDCGACTLVLGEIIDDKLRYRSFDSCLVFMPMLHGKELITVECIGSSTDLHPVQKAMVDTDGSQCGYCTPGFIMSLYYLHQKDKDTNREEVKDVLTGNLCRCTGYRSIMEAAMISCGQGRQARDSKREAKVISMLRSIPHRDIRIISKDQEYMRPAGLEVATQLVEDNTDALIVNGATDLGLKVTKNNELLPKLIDVSDIPKLKEIKVDKGGVYYGAGLNLEDLRQHCKDYFPALYDMLSVFGSRQIRYMGTLGGNIASASPIGDVPPVMIAYDAIYSLVSVEGERNVKARDFVTGYRETILKPNELIKGAFIPFSKKNRTVKSYKISKRKDLDISTVSAGFQLDLDNKKVQDIVLVYGGMAAMTKRAEKAESYLRGKLWERKHVEKAMKLIDEDFTPISDARSGANGRRVMARNLLLKLWNETQYDS